jgi:hypothetical protein
MKHVVPRDVATPVNADVVVGVEKRRSPLRTLSQNIKSQLTAANVQGRLLRPAQDSGRADKWMKKKPAAEEGQPKQDMRSILERRMDEMR